MRWGTGPQTEQLSWRKCVESRVPVPSIAPTAWQLLSPIRESAPAETLSTIAADPREDQGDDARGQ